MAQFRSDENIGNGPSPRRWWQNKSAASVIAALTLIFLYALVYGFGPLKTQEPAGANSARAETADPLKCDFSGIDSPMITVKIENADLTGAELNVPRDYLMSRAIDGATRDALLLQVWKDSFLPYTMSDSMSKEQSKKLSEGRADNLQILISSLKDLDSIAKLSVWSRYPKAGDVHENRKQSVSGQNVTLKIGISGYRTKDGLVQLEKLPKSRFNELLLSEDDNEITDVFSCSQIGSVPFPGCSQIFEYGAYDVKISYRRNDLPRWRELRQKTEQLLDCLTTKTPKNTLFNEEFNREQAETLWQETLPQKK